MRRISRVTTSRVHTSRPLYGKLRKSQRVTHTQAPHPVSPRPPRATALHAKPKPRELLLRRLDPSHFLNERREQTRLNLSVLDAFLP